ncbi:MAG: AAA family ATPase [Methylococcaceae bacterium]|nr:AAA family ATPase [Methylococcaceae bacterium]
MSVLKLSRLKLNNYRCFADIEIDFHPQLTVLVAPNGYGKTAILDAVAIALGPYVGAFDEATGKHFHANDIRLNRIRETTSNEMEYAIGGVSLEAVGLIPGSISEEIGADDSWQRKLSNPTKSKTTIKDAKDLIDYGKRMQDAIRAGNTSELLPVLAYYGTGRLWQMEKLTQPRLQATSRSIAYSNCLDSGSSYKTFAEWFRYWNIAASEQRYKAIKNDIPYIPGEFDQYIESVKNAINACLKPSGWKELAYSADLQELVAVHDDHGELPVAILSDGIRNMIGIVADIAFRATKLNPMLGNRAAQESPGIILIDEVDMHLHPAWQQVVLDTLKEAFPNIQFIVTTHSPQVLSTVHRESIRLLGKDPNGRDVATMPLAESYGEISSDVLESIMHVNPQPPVAEREKLERLTEWVDQGHYNTPDAISLLAELETVFGKIHPQLQKLARSIQRQELLKQ